jgi:NAD-dependent DNA ligase
VRDKELEAALIAKGYTIADSITKKTTHLIYGDTTAKYTKAKELGLSLLTLEQAKAQL